MALFKKLFNKTHHLCLKSALHSNVFCNDGPLFANGARMELVIPRQVLKEKVKTKK